MKGQTKLRKTLLIDISNTKIPLTNSYMTKALNHGTIKYTNCTLYKLPSVISSKVTEIAEEKLYFSDFVYHPLTLPTKGRHLSRLSAPPPPPNTLS